MLAQEVGNFFGVCIRYRPTLPAEVFGRLDDRFGHAFVGIRGTTYEIKALATGNPLVLVLGVEPEAEEAVLRTLSLSHK